MPLYESVIMIRPDVSTADVDKLVENFSSIISENEGKIIKNEYWGLRTLAYEVKKNKKSHYIMLGIDASHDAIKEMERKMRLSEDVIRNVNIKVEEFSDEPTPILKSKVSTDNDVDVTTSANENQ